MNKLKLLYIKLKQNKWINKYTITLLIFAIIIIFVDDNINAIKTAKLAGANAYGIFDNSSKDFFFEEKEENEEIKNSIVNLVTNRLTKFTGLDSTQIQILAPMKAGPCGINKKCFFGKKRLCYFWTWTKC